MPARLALAVAGGLLLWLAQPGWDLWVGAVLGIALLGLATWGTGPRRGALLGLVGSAAMMTPLLKWTGIYVGAVPWLALSLLESLYGLLLGALCGAVAWRPRTYPWVVAGAWVAVELARSTTPYGGFPWGRVAFGVTDSPFLRVAALAGAPGVTFAVALTGGLLALALRALAARVPRRTRSPEVAGGSADVADDDAQVPGDSAGVAGTRAPRRRRRLLGRTGASARVDVAPPRVTRGTALAAAGGAVALGVAPLAIPLPTDGPTARVMAIQGNVPTAGLEFNAQRRAVLDNHANLTMQEAARLHTTGERTPDLVVWPENASDIDPLRNPDAAAVIRAAVSAIGAPTLVGAVLAEPKDHVTNAALLYEPGQTQPTQRYDKRHPVPFAEYIPQRDFFRNFSHEVDLVTRDFVAGDHVGVARVPRAGGAPDIAAGENICFEVAYDDLVRDGVQQGANLIVVQTNNATFGYTDESKQQLAISRLRAVEHGRSVVHNSNVGVSSLITPDGEYHGYTPLFTPQVLAADLPLRSEQTLATRLGDYPAWLTAAATVGAALAASLRARRRRTSVGGIPAEAASSL